MSLICSRRPSGAQLTDFFFFTVLVKLAVTVAAVVEIGGVGWGGVGVTEGDSLRALAIDFKASWKGSSEDGCAMFVSGSFFTGTGAFLKLGSFGLGFGAEKNDESDFASLTAPAFVAVIVDFVICATAVFFVGGPGFGGGSDGFLFFVFASRINDYRYRVSHVGKMALWTVVTHPPRIPCRHPFSRRRLSSWRMPSVAIYVPDLKPCP